VCSTIGAHRALFLSATEKVDYDAEFWIALVIVGLRYSVALRDPICSEVFQLKNKCQKQYPRASGHINIPWRDAGVRPAFPISGAPNLRTRIRMSLFAARFIVQIFI
jgi:hypothetical protein